MITKAVVKQILEDGYKALVMIPIFSSSIEDKKGNGLMYTATATICSINNSSNLIREGDIVIVGFENEDIAKPIILGQLFRPNIDLEGELRVAFNLSNLTTNSTTKLDRNTYIGNVLPENIEGLIGLQCNVQEEINELKNEIQELRQLIINSQND